MMFRALVVDDEAVARRRVQRLLAPFPDVVQVVGEASSGVEALELVDAKRSDLLFLDVQMPGMSGFELARELRPQPWIVFTTAHDEHALAAFRENTIEYLLKPISVEAMARAVDKLRLLRSGSECEEGRLRPLLSRAQPRTTLWVASCASIRPIAVERVVLIEARDKYCLVRTDSETHEVEMSLTDIEARLPPEQFVRIHRRYVVNMNHVRELRKREARRWQVILSFPVAEELFVSRRCLSAVVAQLGCIR